MKKELNEVQDLEYGLSFLNIVAKIDLFEQEDIALYAIKGEPIIEIKDYFHIRRYTTKRKGIWGIHKVIRETHIPYMCQSVLAVNGRMVWDKRK